MLKIYKKSTTDRANPDCRLKPELAKEKYIKMLKYNIEIVFQYCISAS